MPLIKSIEFDRRDISRIKKYLSKTPKVVNNALRKAIAAEARYILKKSQEIVPVKTGLLKSSKFLKRAKSNGYTTDISMGYAVKPGVHPTVSGGTRNVKVDYAPIVEAGSSAFNVGFTGRFFMRRAFSMTKSGRSERIAAFVRKDLRKLRS